MEESEIMRRAIELARRGAGWTSPNPLVGAVIVKDGRVIGEGWHAQAGGTGMPNGMHCKTVWKTRQGQRFM